MVEIGGIQILEVLGQAPGSIAILAYIDRAVAHSMILWSRIGLWASDGFRKAMELAPVVVTPQWMWSEAISFGQTVPGIHHPGKVVRCHPRAKVPKHIQGVVGLP